MATAMKRKSPEPTDAADVTPRGNAPKRLRLTQSQKQALTDNLQLEITERARKLRAQYALQANDLRARIERRVNRIPGSLRKANMGELLEKYNASAAPPSQKPQPAKASRTAANISVDPETASTGTRDGQARRLSHEDHYSDKENAPATSEADGLQNPKRRGKAGAAGGASRVVSQNVRENDSRILSPKSLNSRTYRHSPLRASPDKGPASYMSHPASPLKPSSPLKSAGTSGWDGAGTRPRGATTSTANDNRLPSQAKKTANRAATGPKAVRSPAPRPATRQHDRKNSTGTVSSIASSGTTVTKPTRTGANSKKVATTTGSTAPVVAKKPTVPRTQTASLAVKRNTNAATARKTTAPAATTEGSTRGTRALRKRI